MMVRAGVAFVALATIAAASSAQAQAVSRYTRIDPHACTYLEDGSRYDQDWVRYRCIGEGGISVWLNYSDSTRLSLEFGEEGHDSPVFSADRDPSWPVEWRGWERATFQPYAAIVRTRPAFQFDGDRSTQLSVFRVWRDWAACFLGNVATNEAARALADGAARMTGC